MTRARTIGVDLGTTNSVVATIDDDGVARILTSDLGDTTVPSIVSYRPDADGVVRPVVGVLARQAALDHPADTVYGTKRLIGRRFEDAQVQSLARTLPYEVAPAPNGDAHVRAQGVTLSPQEIAAEVLNELKLTAERFFGAAIGDAIVTVPAYFDNQQRAATKDAAAIAGLDVRRLLNEPTAAALGFGAHQGENRRLAVCDLGGGTFDVSVVNVEDGVFEVISTHGDNYLGGDDFDRVIIETLVDDIRTNHGVDLEGDAHALQRLKAAAQQAKHDLSDLESTELDLPGLGRGSGSAGHDYRRSLSRAELEDWCAPILSRLEDPCREALVRCGIGAGDVDGVVLVGGMTRMPAVQQRLAALFGRPPLKVPNPDEIVAIGAATQCAVLDGIIGGVVLLDVTSRAIGVSVADGRYQRVIPRNATIPTREHKIIATSEDGQRQLTFDVYEGESPDAGERRHIGRFVCDGLPDAPAGEVLVLLNFTVDVDGILRVSTTELTSGERPALRLVATAGLTRADVRRLTQLMTSTR